MVNYFIFAGLLLLPILIGEVIRNKNTAQKNGHKMEIITFGTITPVGLYLFFGLFLFMVLHQNELKQERYDKIECKQELKTATSNDNEKGKE